MTVIRNTDTGEIVEIELIDRASGESFLTDVIANSGRCVSGDEGIDFDFSADETEWWVRWAEREQRINDAIDEQGVEGIIPCFYDEEADWEAAQTAYEQYLGLEEYE